MLTPRHLPAVTPLGRCAKLKAVVTRAGTVAEQRDWKTNGVRVIPGNQLDPNTAQTPGMHREAAINAARVGAQKIWAGTVRIDPDARTGAHHHGALESVIYVVS